MHEMTYEEGEYGARIGLVRTVCSCQRYRSGWSSREKARKAWRDHVKSKTGRWPASVDGRDGDA